MWSFVLLCSCGSASFFDEPTVPTTTKVALSDIVTLKDVQPPDNYGTEAKKAVEYMQSVQKAFDEWGQMMDNQSAATLRNPEAKAIDTRIRELQDKGTIAAQAAENIAAEYGDFALLQRARMESASKDGKLNPDLRLVDAGKRIEDYGAELAGHVRSIRECLEQLSKEVKDMREPGSSSFWKTVRKSLTQLLKVLAVLGDIACLTLAVTPAAGFSPIASGTAITARKGAKMLKRWRKEEEHIAQFAHKVQSTIPLELPLVLEDLLCHSKCLRKVTRYVDRLTYMGTEEAEQAAESWAVQALELAPYRQRHHHTPMSTSLT